MKDYTKTVSIDEDGFLYYRKEKSKTNNNITIVERVTCPIARMSRHPCNKCCLLFNRINEFNAEILCGCKTLIVRIEHDESEYK